MDVIVSRSGRKVHSQPDTRFPVLCVDLDGTLVRTDTLLESIVSLLRRRPYLVFVLPFWLLGGRAAFKQRVAKGADLDVETLPYNAELVSFLRQQRGEGRELVLATASHVDTAQRIACHLGLFSRVFATDGGVNLKARRKAAALAQAFPQGFSYAGNSNADLPVWSTARSAVLVGLSPAVRIKLPRELVIERELASPSTGQAFWRALRPHQWAKNVLVAIPLLTAHRYGSGIAIWETLVAFCAMCLVASSVYLVNDLLDLPEDRRHPSKRLRPLAAGELSLAVAAAAVPILWLGAALLCLLLPSAFAIGLAGYTLAAVVYSMVVKRVIWLDVVWLAGLYTLRIALGALAIVVPVSTWLFAFSAFAFTSLALLKRYVELEGLRERAAVASARGYCLHHRVVVKRVGWACTVAAGGVLLLYLDSDAIRALYRQTALLWPAAALVVGFLGWMWRAARVGRMHEDPVVFALREPLSYVVLLGFVACLLLAR